jgi:RNA polymerase sigma factor (sigma-70 family)
MVQSVRAARHDLELVALAVAGDRAAFGELVRRHGSAVRALLRRMGADDHLADDLAQDAFMAAFEQITDFRGDGTFQAWVKRIAARAYVRRWRRAAREQLMAEVPEREQAPTDMSAVIDLDGALASLTPAERMCVSLCYGAGLSHSEAAIALNAPLGTVKSHVKRGVDKLRLRLAPHGGGLESQAHG